MNSKQKVLETLAGVYLIQCKFKSQKDYVWLARYGYYEPFNNYEKAHKATEDFKERWQDFDFKVVKGSKKSLTFCEGYDILRNCCGLNTWHSKHFYFK